MTPVIDRSVKIAAPPALVSTVVVPPSAPPPVAMETVTPTPAWFTAFPTASRSWSTGCWAKTTLLAAAADGCVVMVSWEAPPVVTVIVPEVAPATAGALKFRVRSPAAPLMVRLKKVAAPAALVSTVVVPPSAPPPVAMETVTPTPAWFTAFPTPSRSWMIGCWANATPLVAAPDGCVVMVSWVAPPTVTVIVPEVTPATAGALKFTVRSPAAPVMDRLKKIAAPLALVVAVSVPPSVPLPVAIAAVTTVPTWLTAFPAASRSWMIGCWANATPLVAAAEGWVVIASWVAAPGVRVIVPDVAPVSDAALKLRVRLPIVPVRERPAKVATPLAFVTTLVVPFSVPPPEAITTVTV